ncbi:hypothetical protein WAI453_008179 [Rhynchosporium graminicola]
MQPKDPGEMPLRPETSDPIRGVDRELVSKFSYRSELMVEQQKRDRLSATD